MSDDGYIPGPSSDEYVPEYSQREDTLDEVNAEIEAITARNALRSSFRETNSTHSHDTESGPRLSAVAAMRVNESAGNTREPIPSGMIQSLMRPLFSLPFFRGQRETGRVLVPQPKPISHISDPLPSFAHAWPKYPPILLGLECSSRTDMQRQLNRLLDPITRLPVEISSEIFILCLPDSGPAGYRRPNPGAALLLPRICTAWADIAHSTHTLWDTIHIDFPHPEGFEHVFHSYLARAQSRGLAFTLTGYDQRSFALLWPESALPVASANLTALTLYAPFALDPAGVLSMLRATLWLVECTLIIAHHNGPRPDSLTLPCLQSLSLGKNSYACDLHLLKYLSVPALRRLTILGIRNDVDEALFVSFLTRLEAPLQSLHVKILCRYPVAYAKFLSLVPTLTCLWLAWDNASECALFSDFLRSAPQGFLAQLRDLAIVVKRPVSDFHPLCVVLSARRSQITSFRFIYEEDHRDTPPPPDVPLTLRQLAAECEMKIHFGTTNTNYI
ncbi:hypothetical protein C8J57DRAFT_1479332 [Mycena rebaudengoi]|nr:hypothetical protein C8J57DRAFT_1479332 [Mycena rebaudengoi]